LRFRCRLDKSGKFLAVYESAIKLLTPENNPLVRLEFVETQRPASHWHVHADRTAFGWLLAAAGRPSHAVAKAHLPAGGARMRPALEDFLEFLLADIGLDNVPGWQQAIADGRETWRRRQVRTLVRDAPGEAVATLTSLGYQITPPSTPPPENLAALRAY